MSLERKLWLLRYIWKSNGCTEVTEVVFVVSTLKFYSGWRAYVGIASAMNIST